MSVPFKEKGAPEIPKDTKDQKDRKDKETAKEIYKEGPGGSREKPAKETKEADKDAKDGADKWKDAAKEFQPEKTIKDTVDRTPGAPRLLELHRRVAALEAAVGIGAPFIAQEERPEVGEAAMSQPTNEKRR